MPAHACSTQPVEMVSELHVPRTCKVQCVVVDYMSREAAVALTHLKPVRAQRASLRSTGAGGSRTAYTSFHTLTDPLAKRCEQTVISSDLAAAQACSKAIPALL